ncbi:MAG: hypothetical protein HRF51_08695 [bacterium]
MPLSFSSATNIAFLIVILFTIILWPKRMSRDDSLPAILTALGIFGTFVGVFVGLYKFDVNDINGSIPQLLEGLKVAFFTSVIGMFCAIGLKWRNAWLIRKESSARIAGATTDTLAELLTQILADNRSQADNLAITLQGIEHSLIGEGDTTLITQLQKLRTVLSDNLDKTRTLLQQSLSDINASIDKKASAIISEFREFSERMAENNSKALISALESVIRDFNTKINEQFGDNFKQLNDAVGRMLDWQSQYKEQMASLIARINESITNLEKIDDGFKHIAEQLELVLALVDEMDTFIKNADIHLKALQKSIDAHAKMAEQAESAFPKIENRLYQLTDGFAQSVQLTVENNQKSVDRLRKAIDEQSTFITEHARSMSAAATKAVSELDAAVLGVFKQNNALIAKQFEQFDRSMEQELNNAIRSLGSQLASLSKKFVDDYTPLTEQLKRLVEISKDGSR